MSDEAKLILETAQAIARKGNEMEDASALRQITIMILLAELVAEAQFNRSFFEGMPVEDRSTR